VTNTVYDTLRYVLLNFFSNTQFILPFITSYVGKSYRLFQTIGTLQILMLYKSILHMNRLNRRL